MMLRLTIVLTLVSCTIATTLDVNFEWKYIDYVWKSKEQKYDAIHKNRYNYSRIYLNDLETTRDGRCFITTPVIDFGVPATLSTVSEKRGPCGPLLEPYPSWEWHNAKHCKGMTNVWRIVIDDCNRLWVLDSGKIGDDQLCPAQYFVFDLETDNLIERIEIPDDILRSPYSKTPGRLTYPVIETYGDKCEETWVYAADYANGGIVIFNGSKLWRRDDQIFHPKTTETVLSFGEENVTIPNGLFSLALTHQTSRASRRLFFRPITSLKEYSVSVDDLHKSEDTKNEVCYTCAKVNLPSPAFGQTFSQEGVLFLGLTKEIAIGCWNQNTKDKHVTIVAQGDEILQVASSMKITKHHNYPSKETIWVLAYRIQEFQTGTLNFEKINFRVLSSKVDALINGTKCQLNPKEHA